MKGHTDNTSFCLFSYHSHCVKCVRIRSYSGPYFPTFGNTDSVRVWENTDQSNSEYGHFLRSNGSHMNHVIIVYSN